MSIPFLVEERMQYEWVACGMYALAVATYVALRYIVPNQPWGKSIDTSQLKRDGNIWTYGPSFSARLAWFAFEIPNLLWCHYYWTTRNKANKTLGTLPVANQILLGLFVLHYVQRSIVYPLLIAKNSKKMPFIVAAAGASFTIVNGFLQAKGLCFFINFPDRWQHYPQFVIGLAVFFYGFTVNVHCDAILRRIRSESKEYRIPNGSLFRFVSTPHYFGEIVEWFGYALANRFSLASTAFLVYTLANLIPRGIEHHAWYHEVFGDKYPKDRKAIIPFLL